MMPPADRPPVLHTDRLILRPITSEDGPDYLRTYGNAEAMSLLGEPSTLEQCIKDAKANEQRWRDNGFASWLVDFIEPGKPPEKAVALLGFAAPDDDGAVSFGWIVAPDFWRRGISTESSIVVLDWFFQHFDRRVLTVTRPDNLGSRKTSERLGFELLRNDGDEYVCELKPSRWAALRESGQFNTARTTHTNAELGLS